MKVYDLVKNILEDDVDSRNSDKKLIWKCFTRLGLIQGNGYVAFEDLMKAPSFETITRCRRKIQERYSTLQACQDVQDGRKFKETKTPSWIFREDGIAELLQ